MGLSRTGKEYVVVVGMQELGAYRRTMAARSRPRDRVYVWMDPNSARRVRSAYGLLRIVKLDVSGSVSLGLIDEKNCKMIKLVVANESRDEHDHALCGYTD